MNKLTIICCTLLLISIIAPAQQPAPGSTRQGWTVACPAGQHMDQDCADVANSEYFEDLLSLNAGFADALTQEEQDYGDDCWACDELYNGCVSGGGSIEDCAGFQLECLAQAMAYHVANVSAAVATYNSMKAALQATLTAALHDCCREDQ